MCYMINILNFPKCILLCGKVCCSSTNSSSSTHGTVLCLTSVTGHIRQQAATSFVPFV